MKKPALLPKLKLEYTLPLKELGIDFDSQQSRDMGKQLKKFYFGYSTLSAETIFVYLMVRSKLQCIYYSIYHFPFRISTTN